MSFVTAQSPALMAAANQLEHLGTAMTAQNNAAAMPTTSISPAAADPVSGLQAMQFSAYGTWYQQVSHQAQAIHQMLVNTLGSNAGSYEGTESTNQATTGSTSLSGLLNALSGGSSSAATSPSADSGLSSNFGATIGTPFNWAQNFSAASSDMLDLAQGQYAPEAQPGASSAGMFGLTGDFDSAPAPVAASVPTSSTGFSGMPVSAGVGQASSVAKLSVPPNWAVGDVAPVSAAPVTTPGAGWAGPPATPASTVTTLPGGVPSVASTQRGGLGIGAPHYGDKPIVMPKPTTV
jgi:PE family/PPE-SVP subfamily C-terminal region